MALSVLLAGAVALTVPLSRAAADRATDRAATDATVIAQTSLAPLLIQSDLEAPVTGDRYNELASGIRERITVPGPTQHVILWSPSGQILYDDDQVRVGGTDNALAAALADVAAGGAASRVQAGMLETFVPLWLDADGPVAVAELDRPVEPVTTAAMKPWTLARMGLLGLLGITLLTALAAFRRRPAGLEAETPAEPEQAPPVHTRREARRAPERAVVSNASPSPAPGNDAATGLAPEGPHPVSRPARAEPNETSLPLYMQPGFRQIQEARDAAEQRARAAEQALHELQERFRLVAATEAELQHARVRIRELETELAALRRDREQVVLEASPDAPRVIIRPDDHHETAVPMPERRG
ncbi:MAG: hypothetical protein ACE14W_12940 [Candidatus Velamenicoccus archaeovorus]